MNNILTNECFLYFCSDVYNQILSILTYSEMTKNFEKRKNLDLGDCSRGVNVCSTIYWQTMAVVPRVMSAYLMFESKNNYSIYYL